MTPKVCFAKGCHNILKPPKKKFCSTKCSKSYHNAVYHAKSKGAVYELEHDGKPVAQPNVQKRRGEVYEKLIEKDLGPLILKGDMEKKDAAKDSWMFKSCIKLCIRCLGRRYGNKIKSRKLVY